MSPAATFKALGDDARISLLNEIADRGPCRLGSVGKSLPFTRQGIRKHIQLLEEANLIKLEPSGREMRVNLDTDGLRACQDFLKEMEAVWAGRLSKLKAYVEGENQP